MDEFFTYIKEHHSQIDSTARSIQYHNQDYDVEDIRCMVKTAIWENLNDKKPITMTGIRFEVLNRIFEEKGIKYRNGELLRTVTLNEDLPLIKIRDDYDTILNGLFILCKLRQEEILVIALFHGLDTPLSLKGKYKEIIDQLRNKCYYSPLSYEQIGKILDKPKKSIHKTYITARRKLDAIKRNNRTGSY